MHINYSQKLKTGKLFYNLETAVSQTCDKIIISKIKITEHQSDIYAVDVPNGPTFLVTNFFVFISTFLKSLQVSIFDRADNSHSRCCCCVFFFNLRMSW